MPLSWRNSVLIKHYTQLIKKSKQVIGLYNLPRNVYNIQFSILQFFACNISTEVVHWEAVNSTSYKYPSFDLVDLELKSEPGGSSAYWLSRCCLYNQYLHLLCQLTSIDACECANKLLSLIFFIFLWGGGTRTFQQPLRTYLIQILVF